ncbi:cupin domain-containing protein [Sphingomonas parva]|uniref:Cupin domain-containing protein n=1 Tax=Sphingomonas parva TaxID=2555898 RepID=A0A4Y8ZWU6_9SPHN|nr:cupin domain-containing protein [Sphingomonas parva]TFI59852.1 cupin domain-containing protein [Sphingomonas parva]
MEKIDTNAVDGPVAWRGPNFPGFGGAAVKLRWIDTPYRWHRNDDREFFLVLSGCVEMRTRKNGRTSSLLLEAGQAAIIEAGEEHVACPRGAARVLVVET